MIDRVCYCDSFFCDRDKPLLHLKLKIIMFECVSFGSSCVLGQVFDVSCDYGFDLGCASSCLGAICLFLQYKLSSLVQPVFVMIVVFFF